MFLWINVVVACHSDNDREPVSQEDKWSSIFMLTEGTYWVYNFSTPDYLESCENWQIGGTETVNDKVYVKLFQTDQNMDEERHVLHLREEAGHVYVQKNDYILYLKDVHGIDNPYLSAANYEDEVLLYNFNLKVGSHYPIKGDVFVDSVTTVVLLDGMKRKMFWLNNGLQVIDGIGCLNSIGGLVAYQNFGKTGSSRFNSNISLKGVLHYVAVRTDDLHSNVLYYEDLLMPVPTDYPARETFSDYLPFVKEGKKWICKTHSYEMRGDTSIVNVPYKKVYLISNNETRYFAAVREENMRVFVRREDFPGKEIMLYDFHPQPQHQFSFYFPPVGYFTVGIYDESNLFWVDGMKRRAFSWVCMSPNGTFSTLNYTYEGVGSEFDPFNLIGSQLLSCWEGDKFIFTHQDGWPDPVEEE